MVVESCERRSVLILWMMYGTTIMYVEITPSSYGFVSCVCCVLRYRCLGDWFFRFVCVSCFPAGGCSLYALPFVLLVSFGGFGMPYAWPPPFLINCFTLAVKKKSMTRYFRNKIIDWFWFLRIFFKILLIKI
jgi:hypothetical protein